MTFDQLYLALVLGAIGSFGGVLLFVSLTDRPRALR